MERMEDMTNVKSLYSPKFEHDNCGIGAVVNIKGKKSHDTVANALTIVETLEHRAGKDAEGKSYKFDVVFLYILQNLIGFIGHYLSSGTRLNYFLYYTPYCPKKQRL